MSMRDPRSVSPEPRGIFGTLSLLSVKSQQVVESCPIDSRTVTFGRDENCDVRLYAAAVSRLHAEINIDALTDKATLSVHGTNGLKLNDALINPPSKYPLADGDIITIHKKMFRFEYSSFSYTSIPSLLDSPMPSRSTNSNPVNIDKDESTNSNPINIDRDENTNSVNIENENDEEAFSRSLPESSKRSRRLSTSSRRQSQRMHVISRAQASPILEELVIRASSQSPLASKTRDARVEMHGDESMEQGQQEEREEDLVWVEQKDEKELEEDVEEEEEAVVASPFKKFVSPARRNIPTSFVTPQPPKRVLKAPRTSLAPRTRKDVVGLRMGVAEKETTEQQAVEEQHEEAVVQRVATPSNRNLNSTVTSTTKNTPSTPIANRAPPMVYETPRSIPLPESMDTPYANDHIAIPEQDDVSMEDPNLSVEELTPEQAQAYLSPRSVPLPPSAETPYHGVPQTPAPALRNSPTTPASALPTRFAQPMATTQVIPQTPRNSQNSLRKNLLLKSARKVLEQQIWRQENASPAPEAQVEVAQSPQRSPVTSAHGETPARKSAHDFKTPSRIALPSPGGTEYSDEYSGEVSEGEGQANGVLQFVYETGQDESEYSTDSEDEDEDESMTEGAQPADHTAPHQGVDSSSISPSMRKKLIELMAQTPDSDDDVDRSLDHVNHEDADIEDGQHSEHGEDEEHDESHEQQEQMEEEQQEELLEDEDKEMQSKTLDNEVSAPATPGRSRGPATRFYTPQIVVTKPKLARGRKSLSERYGPPVRFERVDLTPSRRIGSMGPPVRPSPHQHYQVLARDDETIGWDAPAASPVKQQENEAEMSQRLERRQSLATPRVLPAPPSEGFEKLATPTPGLAEPSPLKLMGRTPATPVVPQAVAAVSSDEDTEEVASPIVGLKRKIKAIRRQSRQNLSAQPSTAAFQRRATVGFALPSTPAPKISHDQARLMRTATPGNRFGSRAVWSPQTPLGRSGLGAIIPVESPQSTAATREINPADADRLVDQMDEQDGEEEVELAQHDVVAEQGEGKHDVPEQVEGLSEVEEDAEGEDNEQDQESAGGYEEDVSSARPILDATFTHQQRAHAMVTPSFKGLKEMHHLPKAMPTPSFAGIRDMLREGKAAPATPAMNGIRNMFALPAQMLTPAMDGLPEMFEQESPIAAKVEPIVVKASIAASPSKTASRSRIRAPAAKPASTKSASTARSTSVATRTRKKGDVEPVEEVAVEKPVAPARRSRTIRTVEVAPEPEAVAASRTTRTKKASTHPSASDSGPDNEVESEVAASTSTAPARRVVRGKPAAPAPVKRAARTAAPKKMQQAAVEKDNEDPLNTIDALEKRPVTKSRATKSSSSATESSASKAVLATKITRPTPATRNKAQPLRETNEQEHASFEAPDAEEAAPPKPRVRATRTAKAAPTELEEPAPAKATRTASRTTTKAVPAIKAPAARKAKPASGAAPMPAATKSRAKADTAAPEPEAPKRVTRARA